MVLADDIADISGTEQLSISKLIDVVQSHHDNTSTKLAVIFEKALKNCEKLDVEFKRPQAVAKQSYG